ncbi:hypothetical protein TrispH2_005497 [Trichoplax sp. H2]|nr:hypothetical protein TrispH2_005497 [Trichoplax sp. H2]|eukprot:RDD42466.1 hypothetical protein TrispH2_005497 [Trichoplax sp. H2]
MLRKIEFHALAKNANDCNGAYTTFPSSDDMKIISILYALFATLALLLNGIFIGYVIQARKKWGSHDILILNISFSDLLCILS